MTFNNFDDLSALAQRVYLWLFMNQDEKHETTCYHKDIQRGIKCEDGRVKPSVNALIKAGYIELLRQTNASGFEHKPGVYRILYAEPTEEYQSGLIATKAEYLERVYTSDEVPTPTANAPSEHEIWGKL